MFDELSGQVFLPEQLTIIQTAYNQACKILVAADEFGSPPDVAKTKSLATAILDIAAAGESSADVIAIRALERLGI